MNEASTLVFRPTPALRAASAALLLSVAALGWALRGTPLAWGVAAAAVLLAKPLLRGVAGADQLEVAPEGVTVRRTLFGAPLRTFTVARAQAREVGLRDGTGALRLAVERGVRELTVLGARPERAAARDVLARVLGLDDRKEQAPPVPDGWVVRAVGPARLALERSPGHRLRAMLGLFVGTAGVLGCYAAARIGQAPVWVEGGLLLFAFGVLLTAFDAGLTREVLVLSKGEVRHETKGLFRTSNERIAPVLALRITLERDSEGGQTCRLVVEGEGATATVMKNFVLPRQALPLARFLRWHVGAAVALPDGVRESDLL